MKRPQKFKTTEIWSYTIVSVKICISLHLPYTDQANNGNDLQAVSLSDDQQAQAIKSNQSVINHLLK